MATFWRLRPTNIGNLSIRNHFLLYRGSVGIGSLWPRPIYLSTTTSSLGARLAACGRYEFMATPDTSRSEGEPAAPSQWFHRHETIIPFALVLFAIVFNLYRLYPEVASSVLGGNDMVMHLLLADAVVEAITQGRNYTDPWQGTMGMGFPLAH